MALLQWNVMFSLVITISPVTYGFLTHVIQEVIQEDSTDVNVFEQRKEIKERALEKLQQVRVAYCSGVCFHSSLFIIIFFYKLEAK